MSAVRLDSPTDVVITPAPQLRDNRSVFSRLSPKGQACNYAQPERPPEGFGSRREEADWCIHRADLLEDAGDYSASLTWRQIAREIRGYVR